MYTLNGNCSSFYLEILTSISFNSIIYVLTYSITYSLTYSIQYATDYFFIEKHSCFRAKRYQNVIPILEQDRKLNPSDSFN